MSYIGQGLGAGVRNRYYYTATGGETSLSGADDNGKTLRFADGTYVDVMLNGITLVAGTDYDTNTADTISGLAALTASDVVEIVVYDVFAVADTVSKAEGGTFEAPVTFADATTHQGVATFQDAAVLNAGTTAERPASPATGSVRYNTTLELYEGYNGKEWTALSATKTPDAYLIANSVRFNDDDSAYLARTPASAGNRRTWTWSGWVKRGNLGSRQTLWSSNDGTSGHTIELSSDEISIFKTGTGAAMTLLTNAVFRDASAWYHIVFAVDTTQATSSDRFKIYVNGAQVTDFSTETYPALNADLEWNNTKEHDLGRRSDNVFYFDGYMSDVYFIDGQALDPTSFGEFDDNGVWNPIAFAGTYGTNGFFLEFKTDSALGTDTSGNGNNWTPSGIVASDQMTDTPTVNYCTWNPLDLAAQTLSDGNLAVTYSANSAGVNATFAVSSGKWYWEWTAGDDTDVVGIWSSDSRCTSYPGATADSYGYFGRDADLYNNNSPTNYGSTFALNDVIGVALDLDAGTLTFYKNNVSQGVAVSGLSGGWRPSVRAGNASNPSTGYANFGQRPFTYTPPTGFVALSSSNLPTPTIADGKEHFEPLLYTGNGGAQGIGGLEFRPDFVWIKQRDASRSHQLYDAMRGATQRMRSDTTGAEDTLSNGLTAFDGSGFTVGDHLGHNQSSGTYVALNWNAGGSTVANTDGTITSQVRANPAAGFSIVGWTGAGSDATVGHGLNEAPELYIYKNRSSATNWAVAYTIGDGSLDFMYLNLTNAAGNASQAVPTNFVIDLDSAAGDVNSGQTYIAYCFHSVDGFSKLGTYTGNGSADGPFIYTGFRPAFVMFKRTDAAGYNWIIADSKRNSNNVMQYWLYPNLADAEAAANRDDFLSNGFKIRQSGAGINASGGTYIFMAFAENPFKTARAR